MTGESIGDARRARTRVLQQSAAAALAVGALLGWSAVVTVTGPGRTADPTPVLFQLAAAGALTVAGFLRMAHWRLGGADSDGLLCAALLALGTVSLPTTGLPATVDAVAHCLGSGLAVVLTWLSLGRGHGRVLAGLAGLTATASLLTVPLGRPDLVALPLAVGTGTAWLLTGLLAAGRDGQLPWAGRLAPLFGSVGVVDLMLGLGQLQPGSWELPGSALLVSVAMISSHGAYVDLVEALRCADRSDRTVTTLRPDRGPRTGGSGLDRDPDRDVDFDVADLVGAVAQAHGRLGQEVRVRGGDGLAQGRPGDLGRALDELLDNARQHASGSVVTVHVLAIGDRVEVAVSDRGPGLSSDAAARLLVDGPDGRGLSRARALMRENRGDLQLRSRIGGATFVLSLPAAPHPVSRTAPAPLWHSAPRSA